MPIITPTDSTTFMYGEFELACHPLRNIRARTLTPDASPSERAGSVQRGTSQPWQEYRTSPRPAKSNEYCD
jgi:hypothetical protein